MEKFCDFCEGEKVQLEGDKLSLDDIINKEIIITGFSIKESKYSRKSGSDYLTLQFKLNDKLNIIFTGSEVLIRQITKYENHIPFITIIKKIDRYYTFT